eukprot:g62994.t1
MISMLQALLSVIPHHGYGSETLSYLAESAIVNHVLLHAPFLLRLWFGDVVLPGRVSHCYGSETLSYLAESAIVNHLRVPLDRARAAKFLPTQRVGPLSLPNQKPLHLTRQSLVATGEMFFKPKGLSLLTMVQSVLAQTPSKHHAAVLNNVMLAGGVCRVPGFAERFQIELQAFFPEFDTRVLPFQNREIGVWQGGRALSCDPEFPRRWWGQWEYQELGPDSLLQRTIPFCPHMEEDEA